MVPTLILFAFAADQMSKAWALDYLAQNGSGQINVWFTITETYNRGIAFGLLQGVGPVVGWLSIGLLVIMLLWIRQTPREMWLFRMGMALVVGGALGNLVDRIVVGQVLDFIQSPIRPGVFNVADVMIHIGLFLSLVGAFWQKPHEELDFGVE